MASNPLYQRHTLSRPMGSYLNGLELGRIHRSIPGEVEFDRSRLDPMFVDGYNDGYLRGK